MAEKTPEEVAIHNALLALFCWVDPQNAKPPWPAETRIFINARETVEHCIRAAVEAERERCAKVAEQDRVGPVSKSIAAAIRAPTRAPSDLSQRARR